MPEVLLTCSGTVLGVPGETRHCHQVLDHVGPWRDRRRDPAGRFLSRAYVLHQSQLKVSHGQKFTI